jgi:Domain of unknown function (DUF4385)
LTIKNSKTLLGWTGRGNFCKWEIRARRYTKHKGGRKYDAVTKEILPWQNDPIKAAVAEIFFEKWRLVRTDQVYLQSKKTTPRALRKVAKSGLILIPLDDPNEDNEEMSRHEMNNPILIVCSATIP